MDYEYHNWNDMDSECVMTLLSHPLLHGEGEPGSGHFDTDAERSLRDVEKKKTAEEYPTMVRLWRDKVRPSHFPLPQSAEKARHP